MEDYLFKYERAKSPLMRSIGEYKIPEIGENLYTKRGKAEIVDVKPYDKVLDELKIDGLPIEDIEDFDRRVEHFLGNKERYFECEIRYPDGNIDCLDWSEYLAIRKRG